MIATALHRLDDWLTDDAPHQNLNGSRRFIQELWRFGLKEARACLFAGLFFGSLFLSGHVAVPGLPRYDLLLLVAISIQAWLLRHGFETWDEFKTIMVFHAVGFALEVFKTSAGVKAWAYPEFAYTKMFGVPLFSGFMYSAVGSYVIQAWRLFDLRIKCHPPHWMAGLLAGLIYLNFFTHHWLPDFRWYLAAAALGLHANAIVVYRPLDRDRRMPLLLAWVLIGFFLWLAENIGTFFHAWQYPNQIGAWAQVSAHKWGAWSLLVMMTFYIVTWLKHVKASINIMG
jgi:uncharacterized membrane protein YoaT (DUF817 family)